MQSRHNHRSRLIGTRRGGKGAGKGNGRPGEVQPQKGEPEGKDSEGKDNHEEKAEKGISNDERHWRK